MTQEEQAEAYAKYLTKVSAQQAKKSGNEDKPGGVSVGFQVNPDKRCKDCDHQDWVSSTCKLVSSLCINTFSRPSFDRKV